MTRGPGTGTGSGDAGRGQIVFSNDVIVARIVPSEWRNIYVIGDVHGCFRELNALLEELDPTDDDLVLFVGDLVRKGPRSHDVLDLVRARPNMLSVRGNNEQLVLDGATAVPSTDGTHVHLRTLPHVVTVGDTVVVHAGIDPRRDAQDPTSLLTVRAIPSGHGYDGPFWFDTYRGPPRVVFGHTVLERPIDTCSVVGLDTGCVYGGALTAWDYRRDEFLSVPADAAYATRDDGAIVRVGRAR